MHNFDLYLPTRMIFGHDRLDELTSVIARYGTRVLITSGGGSVKRSGLYDRVKSLLPGCEIFELSGIAPNPKISSVREGARICRENHVDIILSVGGGSVLDCSKHISCAAFYDGDAWDLVLDPGKVDRNLPVVAIITLAATGSEYDQSGVISNPETNEKMPIMGSLAPVVSFCDPTLTFSVPASQTAAGAADILSHTFEQYLVRDGNILTDQLCEGMIKTVMKFTPIAIRYPENYEARAQLLMASSFGCCGLLAMGRTDSPWVCHGIEHEISAYTDITHGVGLAIITPHWMRYSLDRDTAPRFAQYGINALGLPPGDDPMVTAEKAIERTYEFFRSIGLPATLSEIGVTSEHFEDMADHVLRHWFGDFSKAIRPIERDGILEILYSSL